MPPDREEGPETDITTTIRDLEATVTTDPRTADELLDAVYTELKSLAIALTRRQKPGHTIQATDLVHEAYMRLLGNDDDAWNGRAHFFGAAAQAMRRILVEQARRKATLRRGGGWKRHDVDEVRIELKQDPAELLALVEALDRLEAEDSTKAALVKLRHFTGMTIPQAAKALGISHATAERYWAYSRARLHQWIEGRGGEEG
jgi:RNA polymerase sigma factor (TIGR02999 family)